MEFSPFSEAKAKLSDKVRSVVLGSKRLTITTNGRPTVVLLSYEDYLSLVRQLSTNRPPAGERVIDLHDWKKGLKRQLAVRDSIVSLFDTSALSRKGQKAYKRKVVRGFHH